jgi:hypothetical protein
MEGKMKLSLFRSQHDQKGVFGGHKGVNFVLRYKLEANDEELQLINHYKVSGFKVHEFVTGHYQGQPITAQIHVQDLINGSSIQLRDFYEVTKAEEGILQGANNLKGLLVQMRKFGGEEIIEI